MAQDYSINLKANLDTSEVQLKLLNLQQVGQQATSMLDSAVKQLSTSVNELAKSWKDSANESQKANFEMQKLLRGGGAMLIGGYVRLMGNIAGATGNTGLASAASVGGAALAGAGAGNTFGPIGAATGAVVGALGSLTEAALSTAKALKDSFESSRDYIQSQAKQADMQQRLDNLSLMGSKEWNARRQKLEAQIRDYEIGRAEITDKVKGWTQTERLGPEEEQKFVTELAEKLKELEEAAKMAKIELAEMARIEAESAAAGEAAQLAEVEKMKAAEAAAAADRKAAEAAKQKAEADAAAAQKQAELISLRAGGMLGSFAQQLRLEAFGKSLENMSPTELQNLRDLLSGLKAQAASSVVGLLEQARATGNVEDLEAAKESLNNFNEIVRMLSMTESSLGGISTPGLMTPSIQQQMAALGSEAQKGYDVSGYGHIERDMLQEEKKTQENTKQAAESLVAINTKVDEMKNIIQMSNGESKWA